MPILTKREILIKFFENDKLAANRWLHLPIEKLSNKTPNDILSASDEDKEGVEYLFDALESGVFKQKPSINPLTENEKIFLKNAGAKGID